MSANDTSLIGIRRQIAHCNAVRVASGLPPLDTDEAVKAAAREWNRLRA